MAPELLEVAPTSALAVFAHPDDSDISCGATLARWAERDCDVQVVVCALGDKGSNDPAVDPGELAARRATELAAAEEQLGISAVHQLDHRDGELENDLTLRRELVVLLRRIQPEVVVCPDPLAVFFGEHYYNHRDHRVVGWAALDAVAPAAASPLYFPDAGPPHAVSTIYLSGTLEPNCYVEVDGTIEKKAAAVAAHKSQLGESDASFREAVFGRAEEVGQIAGVGFAEAFRRVRLGR